MATWAAAALILLVVSACHRDPAEWPPREIASLETTVCPGMIGAGRPCRCYAKEFSRRVPFSRSKEFAAAPEGSKGFEDVLGAMEASLRECGREMELGPWPASLAKGVREGCIGRSGGNAETCDCLLSVYERRLRYSDAVAAQFAVKAGKPVPDEVKNIYSGEEALGCFAVAAGAPWPPSTRSKIVGECEAKGEIAAALCPCIADRMMATITWQEVALMALGRDGGAAVEAKVAASASHWARDCAVGKPQAPSRNP